MLTEGERERAGTGLLLVVLASPTAVPKPWVNQVEGEATRISRGTGALARQKIAFGNETSAKGSYGDQSYSWLYALSYFTTRSPGAQ